MTAATTRIGSVVLGEGRPKLCVPLIGSTVEELRAAALEAAVSPAELVELRVDFFAEVDDLAAVRDAIVVVREVVPVPILFTFRSLGEGGERQMPLDAYEALIAAAVASGSVDAVDVELATAQSALDRIVSDAHASGVPVVLSSHDFTGTPSREALLDLLGRQQSLGADVLKVAVTPTGAHDVLTLLDATEEFVRTRATRPVVTMSMGGVGLVSRLAGEVFGSALTFGTTGAASAPGQIDARELADVLDLVHRALAD